MELFVRRMIQDMGLELCSEGGLMGLLPWFTCEKGIQSYDKLVDNIRRSTPPEKCAFVAFPGQCPPEPGPECGNFANEAYHRRRICK